VCERGKVNSKAILIIGIANAKATQWEGKPILRQPGKAKAKVTPWDSQI